MSHLDARQRGGKAVAGSSGTGPRGAGNGQPGAKATAGDDLARAERFLSPGGADPDAVSGTVDLNPAVVRTTSWCDRTKPNGPGASSGGGDGNPVAAIDDAAMEGHGDGGETGGGDNGLSDPTDVGTSAAASAPMPPPSAAAAAGRRRPRAHTAKKGAHFTPDPLAAVRARLLEDRRLFPEPPAAMCARFERERPTRVPGDEQAARRRWATP